MKNWKIEPKIDLIFFVKLDFEIAVDQQTEAHDRTFEGSSGLHVPTGARGIATPLFGQFWLNFGSILSNNLSMFKTILWSALLVATNLLDTYIKLIKQDQSVMS